MRGATETYTETCQSLLFQPTRPLRGATSVATAKQGVHKISTHAPLAGRDTSKAETQACGLNFNPRAPCGARRFYGTCHGRNRNFNPRAPCGARQNGRRRFLSIVRFQPTRPLRGATSQMARRTKPTSISTHAPLAGRDSSDKNKDNKQSNFNPRAPCGARLRELNKLSRTVIDFNPRAPCGARQQKSTNHYAHFCDNRQISDAFAQNAACQGILLLFDAGKPCGFWVRTAQVISAHLCFAL